MAVERQNMIETFTPLPLKIITIQRPKADTSYSVTFKGDRNDRRMKEHSLRSLEKEL